MRLEKRARKGRLENVKLKISDIGGKILVVEHRMREPEREAEEKRINLPHSPQRPALAPHAQISSDSHSTHGPSDQSQLQCRVHFADASGSYLGAWQAEVPIASQRLGRRQRNISVIQRHESQHGVTTENQDCERD